jgi:type IV secretory pathway VirB9-like protein
MKQTNGRVLFALLIVSATLLTGQGADARRAAQSKRPVSQLAPKRSPEAVAPESRPEGRIIRVGPKDVVRLKAKLRYTTLVVLPASEQILDYTCGDKDFWSVDGHANLALVKPAKAGSQTNMNLITASGNIYSFVLAEVSEVPNAEPDLKVFIEPKDESMITAARSAPKFVSSQTVEDYRQQVKIAKEEAQNVKQSAEAEIDRRTSKFITNMRFPYQFQAGKKPFYLRAMYHDGRFTYIQARPEETPTLYEVKDGQPNLVNFEYRDGVYVVTKILDRGYFVIGKQKQGFRQE